MRPAAIAHNIHLRDVHVPVRRAVQWAVRRLQLLPCFSASLLGPGVALALDAAPAAESFGPIFNLRSLHPAAGGDGSKGFIAFGINEDYSGAAVSNAGDVNGDGIDDFVIASMYASPNDVFIAGQVYVVFGRSTGFPAAFELRRLLPAFSGDGSEGFVLNGSRAEDSAGVSVSGAGDVNGDGIDDLLIGASAADPNGRGKAGKSYVVFGRRTGFPAEFELRSLEAASGGDGSEGFVLQGIDGGDFSGRSLSSAGDVDGDGIDDLIVGAPRGGPTDAGESYVVFGRTTHFPAEFQLRTLEPASGGDGSQGFILKGIHDADRAGGSVSGAGDVNGDGIDDLIIGAEHADPHGRSQAGESYVVFGRTTGFPAVFGLRRLHPAVGGDGSEGFILKGIDDSDTFWGISVSGAGDVNGDGVDDLIIGAEDADNHGDSAAGESYVVFGRTTGFPAAFELRSLHPAFGGDGSEGVIMKGFDGGESSGWSVSRAGDMNGDGIDDVIIGARLGDHNDLYDTGSSYVVFGRTTGFPAAFELRSLRPAFGGDGSEGVILQGIASHDFSGQSVSDAGDVNADGLDDVIIGAPRADRGDQHLVGESYVVFGRAAATTGQGQ